MSLLNGTPNSQEPSQPTETPLEGTPPTQNNTPAGDPPVDGTPPTAPAPEPVAPITYTAEDLQIPEGFTIEESSRDELLGILNNSELDDKGRLNAMLNLHTQALSAASEANSNAWAEMQTQWQEEVKAHPEIGGAKFESTILQVGKLMEEYGTPELRQAFDFTGAGNNVHVISFLAKVAGQLTEGGFVSGGATQTDSSAASKLFPSMKG